jgi:anthranilate/para-aminobenzoate synthase component II
MLLIISRAKNGIFSHVPQLCMSLRARKIPYIITKTRDPAIIRRKDVNGIIIPGCKYRIHPEEQQDDLELELYYLFHFPKLPVLGICHGCQFLMTYYGGDLVSYNRLWIGSKDIELDLSRDKIFRDEERRQKIHVYFHELPVMTPKASKAGVREIAWITKFRDGKRRACAFEFEKDRVYGFMFHPEGKIETRSILYNFYDNICVPASASASSSSS